MNSTFLYAGKGKVQKLLGHSTTVDVYKAHGELQAIWTPRQDTSRSTRSHNSNEQSVSVYNFH
jgi:hypothetical protein